MSDHYRERLAQLTRSLAPRGLEGLVLYVQGSHAGPASASHGTLRFLTDWNGHLAPALLVLRPEREPVLLVPNYLSVFLQPEQAVLDDVRFAPPGALADAAVALLREDRAPKSLAVLHRAEMPLGLWEPLSAGLPGVAWTDLTEEIDAQRVIKSPDQIERHEAMGLICDAMFETLRLALRAPRPAFQLQADMERTARYAGCEFVASWLTIRPEADHVRFTRAECLKVPEPGDQILAGLLIQRDGYWGHAVRTGSFGEPKPAHRRVHAIAMEMQNAMAMALKPGHDLHDVQSEARRVLEENLTEAELAGCFRFRDAHSLGFSYEDPVATRPFPQPYGPGPAGAAPEPGLPMAIMPGMLLELHPNLFVPGVGGACIGDMVVVTPQHCRALTQYDRDLTDWAA